MLTPDLPAHDWIVVSSSGGKDSQTTLDVVHDLGRVVTKTPDLPD